MNYAMIFLFIKCISVDSSIACGVCNWVANCCGGDSSPSPPTLSNVLQYGSHIYHTYFALKYRFAYLLHFCIRIFKLNYSFALNIYKDSNLKSKSI